MEIIKNPPREIWAQLVQRPSIKLKKVRSIVKPIMKKVKRNGDNALIKFALEFDLVHLESLAVSQEEINAAAAEIDKELKAAIEQAILNIDRFHRAQKTEPIDMETQPGVRCMRKSVLRAWLRLRTGYPDQRSCRLWEWFRCRTSWRQLPVHRQF